MSSLYFSQHEVRAIKALNICNIERCVEQALEERHPAALFDLHIAGACSYIATRLHRYERDLANYAKSKAATKRSETRSRAWSSGHNLVYAIREMKQLVEQQEKETQLLQINDQIFPPRFFRDRVEVHVSYQWRTSVEAEWAFGSITFSHAVDMRPSYTPQQPKRKPSAAKLEEQRQEMLFRHWDHLRMLALEAVREFLKSGGDGSSIPVTFEAKPDSADRYLNNYSCNFWAHSETLRKIELAGPAAIQVTGSSDECSADRRLKQGARVRHAKFGDGTITHIVANQVIADFGETGFKRVMASFLEPLAE